MPERLGIGVDIGGTKVTAGVVDQHGRLREVRRSETPTTSSTDVADVVAELVADLRLRHDVVVVGVGAAGFVDASRSAVLFAPHLAWRIEPLQDALVSRVGLPVLIENDANAAAWGEWRFGAAQEEDVVVGITLGTGIGGGIILEGEVYRGRFGLAGEFGHMQVIPGGRRCECGNDGCWEQYASGNALVREARELAVAGSPLVSRMVDMASGDATAITGPLVTRAAQSGDRAAVELLARVAQWLGVGLANLAAALDPGVFVVGGGLSEAGELLIGPARSAFAETLTGRGFRPQARVVPARLGNDAGMIGAAALARRALGRPG